MATSVRSKVYEHNKFVSTLCIMSKPDVIGARLPCTGVICIRTALERVQGLCYHGATPLMEKPQYMKMWVATMERRLPNDELKNQRES